MAFDTFILYNSNITGFVESTYRQLKAKNLSIFFDKEHIKLGDDSIDSLEIAIKSCKNMLVSIGEEGGPWQRVEIKAIINELFGKKSKIKIIPILLPNVSPDKIPLFLRTLTRATLNDVFDFKTIDTIIDQLSNKNVLTPIYNLENGETEDKYGKPLGFKAHTGKIITLLIGESIYQNSYVAIKRCLKIIFGKIQFLFRIIWQLGSSIHASAEFAECRPVVFSYSFACLRKNPNHAKVLSLTHLHLTGTKPFADGGLDANSISKPTILS